jgi:hypothetical protein
MFTAFNFRKRESETFPIFEKKSQNNFIAPNFNQSEPIISTVIQKQLFTVS